MMPRWLRTAKRSDDWRTGSTVLSSITSQGASTRRPTRLQKPRLAESRCRHASSLVIRTNPQSAMRSRNKMVMGCLPWARGLTSHRLHLTLRSWSLMRV